MSEVDPKYFDYAASVPPFAEAIRMFAELSEEFYANPSSMHKKGVHSSHKLDDLKEAFCELLHFDDGRLLLCSSATEANNTVIEGFVRRHPGGRILIAEDAHDSIWYTCKRHARLTDTVGLDSSGHIKVEALYSAVVPETGLVCINHACGETGTIHNIFQLGAFCQEHKLKLLVDGTQAVGHIPVDLNALPFEYYTFSAHKFGGLRGTGGMFFRDDDFDPLISGGRQEWNLRAGTENLAGLGAAVTALDRASKAASTESRRLRELASRLLHKIREKIPQMIVNTQENSLPGLLSLSFPGHDGTEIVAAMSVSGFSISTGSACHANQIEPSRIVMALGRGSKTAKGTVRISMGYATTRDAVDELGDALINYII